MSDFKVKLSLIRGICEGWDAWDIGQRVSACSALSWLCGVLIEEAEEQFPDEEAEYVIGILKVLRKLADEGSVCGQMDVDLVGDEVLRLEAPED